MTDYDAIYSQKGLPALLKALAQDHGTPFIDATTALLALRPSFSRAEYIQVAQLFGLSPFPPPDNPFAGWDDLDIPQVALPLETLRPLVHQQIASFANPGPISELENEAATALFLSGTFQSLVALFGGILRDKPETVLPGTQLNSGGKIQGEIFCKHKMIVFVRELKHNLGKRFLDALAQVLCEVFAVWHHNRRHNVDFSPSDLIAVRACLCDGRHFHFVSYAGYRFSRRSFCIPTPWSDEGICGYAEAMVPVFNYTFALLLEGYCKTTEFYYQRSMKRGEIGDNSPSSSSCAVTAPVPPLMGERVDRYTNKGWHTALCLSQQARALFRRAHECTSSEVGNKALGVFEDSLKAWPISFSLMLPGRVGKQTTLVMERLKSRDNADPDPSWVPACSIPFPVTVREWRAERVEAFWRTLKPLHRQMFEHPLVGENDSFTVLAQVSTGPWTMREDLERVGSKVLASELMRALENSRLERNWGDLN